MTTILHRLNYSHAPSAGLAPVEIYDEEIQLVAEASLTNWWRADTGFDSLGWGCRKTGAVLVPERTAMPTLQPDLAEYNGKPSLLFTDASQLWDNGANLVPIGGDFTLVCVGRAGNNDNAFLLGGAASGEDRTMLIHQSTAAASGTVQFAVGNDAGATTNFAVTADAEYYFAGGPNLLIGSHAPGEATARQSLSVNNVDKTGSPTYSATPNAAYELHVGGVNVYGDVISGGISGGDIAEIMVFSSALHVRTDLRDLVKSYLNARYALW